MNRKIPLCLLFILVLLPSFVYGQSDRAKAKSYNTRGYALYKEGKFSEALSLFNKAIDVDSTYGQGHYNAACTLGVLRAKEGPCGKHQVYKEDIVKHLLLTLKHLPHKRSKMVNDPDLRVVHDTFGWQVILGRSATKTEDVIKILSEVSWYGPSPGAYGPIAGYDFKPDMTVANWSLDIGSDNVSRVYLNGGYEVKGNNITLIFHDKDGKEERIKGTLSPGGILIFDNGKGRKTKYSDDPDECSA